MAVTAYSARGDEERIRAAGAQAYVSKPISVVRFAQTVDELLASERGDREPKRDDAGRRVDGRAQRRRTTRPAAKKSEQPG